MKKLIFLLSLVSLSCQVDEIIPEPIEYDLCSVESRVFTSQDGDTLEFFGNWSELVTDKDIMLGSDSYRYENYYEDGICKILFYIPDFDIWEYRYDSVYDIDTGEQIEFFLFGIWWE